MPVAEAPQLGTQHMVALTRANRIRILRADDKKLLKLERLDAAVILRNPPEHWENATVAELLMSMYRVGRRQAQRWLAMEHVSETRKLAGDSHYAMTPRQRAALAAHLDTWSLQRDRLRRQMEHAA